MSGKGKEVEKGAESLGEQIKSQARAADANVADAVSSIY